MKLNSMHSRILRAASLALSVAGLAAGVAPASAGDWPQWRGPLATGVAPDANPPLVWSEDKNVRWKVPLEGLGSSTPVVWGDRLFVTTAVDSGVAGGVETPAVDAGAGGRPSSRPPANKLRFVLMALDRATGAKLWERTAREVQPREGTHPDGTYASPSPMTDGERVYAFFGSQGLYAFDLHGEPLWQQDLGDMTIRLGFGEGSSPVLAGDSVIVNWDHEGDSFIAALDKRTGKERWRTPREEQTSWSTPLVVEHEGGAQVVVSATNKIRSYALADGALVWEASGMTLNAIPTPVHEGGVVYLTSGFRGNSAMAIRLDGAHGDITGSANVLWTLDRDTPYVPSPLLYDGILYFLKSNNGVVTAVDVASGKVLYGPERVEEPRNVYASPVGAAGRIYLVGREGAAVVLEAGPKFKVLARNVLDDRFDASPAVSGNQLFLRGRASLYCLEQR